MISFLPAAKGGQTFTGILDMWASLENVRRNGFLPATIIDGGAYVGEWARRAMRSSRTQNPYARGRTRAKADTLAGAAARLGNGSLYRITLLGPEKRSQVPYKLMETGSSVLDENTSFSHATVVLPMQPLDAVVADTGVSGPFLLKLDVQGYELEVLKAQLALSSPPKSSFSRSHS